MAQVQVRFTTRAVEVRVWGQVLFAAAAPDDACRVADWASFHLGRGATLDALRAGLRGEPMRYEAEGVLLADAERCRGALMLPRAELARALASGALDGSLGALIEAEHLGRVRPAVLRALERRRRWIAAARAGGGIGVRGAWRRVRGGATRR